MGNDMEMIQTYATSGTFGFSFRLGPLAVALALGHVPTIEIAEDRAAFDERRAQCQQAKTAA